MIILLLWEFFTAVLATGFSLCLSDSKSLQVPRTLLNIMVDFNNAVVSTRPLISKSSNPFTSSLGIVLSALIAIGITITFMFHSFFSSSSKIQVFFIIIIIIVTPFRVFHTSVSG